MALILPAEAETRDATRDWVEAQIASNSPICEAHYLDLKQSMQNGGGPACLRLRVVLTEEEMTSVAGRAILTPVLADQIEAWINRHYRDRLAVEDLAGPSLLVECRAALDELTAMLSIGSVYDFQA